MQITRESLESKKKNFQAQLKQLESNLNALMGAIQLIDIQIQELDAPEPEPVPAKKDNVIEMPKKDGV